MIRHIARVAFVSIALTCWIAASEVQAAMGLTCSDWLNARAHVRFDERTGKFVQVNPPGAPPVSQEVDQNAALLNFYVSGIVETLTWLDPWLSKLAETPNVQLPPKLTIPALLDDLERLCRGGLQKESRNYDVLDIVSQNNQGLVMLRVIVIQELIEKYMEAGRREGARR